MAEVPPSKGKDEENFPVGSILLSRRLRPHIMTFYAFARAIDDIADSPDLSADEKIARLDDFARVLQGIGADHDDFEKAAAMRASLASTDIRPDHCLDLIRAFKQDAVKNRYKSWHELMDSCNLSAAPVGRYLLDLHGENPSAYPASDALCNALQVINHIQDCRADYLRLNRIYLPLAWLSEMGQPVDALGGVRMTPGLMDVRGLAVDAVMRLLDAARVLPLQLKSSRLRMEASVIIEIARALVLQILDRDFLAELVTLSRWQYARCFLRGIRKGIFRSSVA